MNKKGVSPIIATLLLIVIAVAAAVVTYAFVTGFIGTSSGAAGSQGSMSFDTYSIDTAGANVTVYLRNTGTKALNLAAASGAAVYIDGVAQATFSMAALPGGTDNELAVGEVDAMVITPVAPVLTAGAHQLRVVAADGTPLQISIVK